MAKCIICLKEDIEETVEHIIPYALGNKHLTIKCVCKKCNYLLGSKIDAVTTNKILANLFRGQNNVQGQMGQEPALFTDGATRDGKKIKISKDFTPIVIDSVRYDEKNNKYQVITSTPKRAAIEIIDKKLVNNNLSLLNDNQKGKIRKLKSKKIDSEIESKFQYDLIKFNLELIKISYEIFYYLYGDLIFEDEELFKLRQILADYIYFNKYDLKCFNGLTTAVEEPFLQGAKDFLKSSTGSTAVHLISVQNFQDRIVIFIEIEGMLTGAIRLNVTDKLKEINSHTLMIFYPNGEIWRD